MKKIQENDGHHHKWEWKFKKVAIHENSSYNINYNDDSTIITNESEI